MDRFRHIMEMPKVGGYAEYHHEALQLGGEAANTAVALHRLGQSVVLRSNYVGNGQHIHPWLIENGIDVHGCPISDSPEPSCDIYLTPDGERTMFGRQLLAPDSVPWGNDIEWVSCDPNLGEASREELRRAFRQGKKTYGMDFFQPDDPYDCITIWQSSTDWWGNKGNLHDNHDAFAAFTDEYGFNGILTAGAQGCLAGRGDALRHYPAFRIPQVVDATGCGDCFRAGVIAGLNEGKPFEEALMLGAAVGALNATKEGASAGAPTMLEALQLIAEQPEISAAYRPR